MTTHSGHAPARGPVADGEPSSRSSSDSSPVTTPVPPGHDVLLDLATSPETQHLVRNFVFCGAYEVDGGLDQEILERAVSTVWSRWESLRVRFRRSDAGWKQVVSPQPDGPLTLVDLPECDTVTAVVQHGGPWAPFDRERGPLSRIRHLRLPTRSILVFSFDHLVIDGGSAAIVLQELCTAYSALAAGEPVELPEPGIQLTQWSQRQLDLHEPAKVQRHVDFWIEALGTDPAATGVEMREFTPTADSRHDVVMVPLDATDAGLVRQGASARGASLFQYLLAQAVAVVGRESDRDDVVVKTSLINRWSRDERYSVAPFALDVYLRLPRHDDPDALLADVRGTLARSMVHGRVDDFFLWSRLWPGRYDFLSNQGTFYFGVETEQDWSWASFAGEPARAVDLPPGPCGFGIECTFVTSLESELSLRMRYQVGNYPRSYVERICADIVAAATGAVAASSPDDPQPKEDRSCASD